MIDSAHAMTNAVYQATIAELEALMSPRVVSRSLQEGLRALGKSPLEVDLADVEQILKGQVYRQLQVTMPVTEAKAKIVDIMERLRALDEAAPRRDRNAAPPAPAQQSEGLEALEESLKPYNLYFEWPEVQKLRAQLQLLRREQEAGHDASRLLQEARAQLAAVERKLEDQLVEQARALGDLQDAFETVKALGGPRVRRLEGLLGQVEAAQRQRHLAPAEVERAEKLILELRKLLESSVVLGAEPQTEAAALDPDRYAPDVGAKLRRIDRQGERQTLEKLKKRYAVLLGYAPELASDLDALAAQLEQEEPVAAELAALEARLESREARERQGLEAELRALAEGLSRLPEELDTGELSRLLQVSRSVLDTTLPPQRDIQQLRELHQLARQQAEALERQREAVLSEQAAKLSQQAQVIDRLQSALARHRGTSALAAEVEALGEPLARLERAQDERRADAEALAQARFAEQRLEAAAASYAELETERQRAQLYGLLSEVRDLPLDEAEAAPLVGLLETQLEQLERGPLPEEGLELVRQAVRAREEELREAYRRELATFRDRASALGVRPLLARLAADEAALEEGAYPDLAGIERALSGAAEARRAEQLHDLHRLEGELGGYGGSEGAARLQGEIDRARERLSAGEVLPSLAPFEAQLEALKREVAERSADFVPRLDAALARFAELAKLNTDEATAAGRILRHLDGQRGAFARVSGAVRGELERALEEAEGLLEHLDAQFEAARTVAGQLAGGGALDGFFGAFDEPSPAPAPPLEPRTVDAWLEALVARPAVRGALLVGEALEARAGELSAEALELSAAASRLERDAGALGHELRLGALRLGVLEAAGRGLLLATPAEGYRLVLELDEVGELPPVLEALEPELHELQVTLLAS